MCNISSNVGRIPSAWCSTTVGNSWPVTHTNTCIKHRHTHTLTHVSNMDIHTNTLSNMDTHTPIHISNRHTHTTTCVKHGHTHTNTHIKQTHTHTTTCVKHGHTHQHMGTHINTCLAYTININILTNKMQCQRECDVANFIPFPPPPPQPPI